MVEEFCRSRLYAFIPFQTANPCIPLLSSDVMKGAKSYVLLFTKRQKFRLVQIENFCRQQNKCDLKIVLRRTENFAGKGENSGYQHFLLYQQCFQKASCFKVVKSRDCMVKI